MGEVKTTSVRTPDDIQKESEQILTASQFLSAELHKHGYWTKACTERMVSNPLHLFLYDKMEHYLGKALGVSDVKVALNPVMILCRHPDCHVRGSKPIKLSRIGDIKTYIKHLRNHFDAVGEAMLLRFEAISNNNFMTAADLDKLSPSPYMLMGQSIPLRNEKYRKYVKDFGINRKLKENYTCHWKNKFISSGVIDTSSLSFQEDDARLYTLLHYPNPVRDWSKWNTLFWYSVKLLTSISSTALNLYRGKTNYPRLSGNSSTDIQTFNREMNHPSPGGSTVNRIFPPLNYEKEKFHKREMMFHLKVLLNCSDEAVVINYEGVKRFPVTIGIDEQEINAGTFKHNDCLYGLSTPLSVEDLKSIGLDNLPLHISKTNNFINAVREYRLTDLKGCMCSNVYTSFLSAVLTTDVCVETLNDVVKVARTCWHCLQSNSHCNYNKIQEKCSECLSKGIDCISLIVMIVLWDMGSAHKGTSKEITKIEASSAPREMVNSSLFSIAFGGLHLCKAVINALRCYCLTHNGENFGLYMLRAFRLGNDKAAEHLSGVKNAVFLAKDRQSDFLCWMTCGPHVQDALLEKKEYCLIRVPEKILSFNENAKTQKNIVRPVALQTNSNGDVFLLDPGASCIHIYDRSDVAKAFIIGKYGCPQMGAYTNSKEIKGKDVLFGPLVTSMVVSNDNLYVSDESRGEIVVIRKCDLASQVSQKRAFILKFGGCLQLLKCPSMLVVLHVVDSDIQLKGIKYKIPLGKSKTKYLQFETLFSYSPQYPLVSLFNFQLREHTFGGRDDSGNIIYFEVDDQKCSETALELQSSINPCYSEDGLVVVDPVSNKCELKTVRQASENELCFDSVKFFFSKSIPLLVHRCGKVLYVVGLLEGSHVLEEIGSLGFALQFCRSVAAFYDSIGYVPPHGDKSIRSLNLLQAIEKATPLVNLLTSMQDSMEDKYETKTSFTRLYGIPASGTIQSFQSTLEAWKGIAERLNFLSEGLHLQVYPHAISNEVLVENAFGYTMRKGQGHNQSMNEYLPAKHRHAIDFQMRLCDVPFNQEIQVKLRDKGYQAINPAMMSKIPVNELREIFDFHVEEDEVEEKEPISLEDLNLLQASFLLSKSVPRQTNRCKWRALSGHAPNMLREDELWSLRVGDLVFHEALDGILFLVVQNDLLLTDVTQQIEVVQVNTGSVRRIAIEKLLIDKNKILAMPSYLYSLDETDFHFISAAEEIFADILDKRHTTDLTDEDWAVLCSVEPNESSQANPANPANQDCPRRTQKLFESRRKKNKKHNYCLEEWVAVVQGSHWTVGQIKDIDDHHLHVKTMEQSIFGRNIFKWRSDSTDIIESDDVLCNVNPPTPTNSRGGYALSEVDFQRVSSLIT